MKKWIPIGIIGAVALVVGGTFFFQKVIEGSAPEPLTLDSPAPTSGGPFVSTGTWRVGSGSIVGYRVEETLFGQHNTAAGRSTAVTGSVNVDGNTIESGNFSVDMTTFQSNRSQRDNQFNNRIMETATFPTSTFQFDDPIAIGTIPASGVSKTLPAKGKLTLHGVTKDVTFNVIAVRNGNAVQAQGTIPIAFSDYNIADPSGGPARVGTDGTLEFKLNFVKS